MSNLSAFLSENALQTENTKYIASKRFIGEDGKPIEWEITAISSAEDEELRKSCTKRICIDKKRGQYKEETDFSLYLGKLAARCTVFPNLYSAELQNSYGVMGADNLLKKVLHSGEYADYTFAVQEANGFDISQEELVEEAKN